MNESKLNDDIFDTIIRRAVCDVAEAEGEELYEQYKEGPEVESTQSFEELLEELNMRLPLSKKRKRTSFRVLIAAAAIMILMIALFTTPAAANIQKLYDYIVGRETTHLTGRNQEATQQFYEHLQKLSTEWDSIYMPNFERINNVKPNITIRNTDEYTLVEASYVLEEGTIHLLQRKPVKETVSFDLERGDYEEIVINGYPAYINLDTELGEIYIEWYSTDTAFYVHSELGEKDTVEFAESLIKIER